MTKWAHPKPFCAIPLGERAALEIFIDPLADFLAGKLADKPHKAPTFLRPLIAELNDYKKLALMGVSPLLDCMTWDRDGPSAAAKLKLRVGAEMEAQMAFIGPWTEERRLRAGHWLVSQALALDLFDVSDGFPKISDKWLPELECIREEMIRAHPVHMPLFDPPPAWTGFWRECPDRLRVPFVRRDWWPEHRAAIAECFKDPGWEHARGAHALERVPCLIDTTMRDLVDRYAVEVMGRIGQQRRDDEWQVADDIRTAKYIGDRLFYIDRNVDKRGRINSVPHFNFDNRGDHVRSMFRFARGMELDRAEGTQWLEVHCANCNGENGIDKRPWDERINWVARNRELIQKIADDPEGTFELWRGVDSPFCFVAACRELAAAWKDPKNFETHLPIGFDGSCNGLQHLALIARDPETAFMVNVGPHPETGVWPRDPQDVYGLVVAETKKLLLADTNPWASWWISRFKDLGDKDTRKLIKTPAMTFAYSVTQGGMRDHIAEVYRTLRCANSHSHYDSSQPEGARDGCSYLAGKIIEACRGLLKEPTRVMEYVQQLAEHRISRGLFLEWVNQSDFPVLHRYHRPKESETINLKTYGVRVRHNLVLAFEDAIWREKTINAAAANLVHSLDAAHLIKVVIHAGKELIRDIITTHDCYYCLAPQATKLNQIIRYEMGEMYRVNVLADLRRRNVDFDILPPPAMVRVIRYEGDVLANRPEPGVRHIPAPAFPELDPLAVNFSEAAFS